MPVPAFGEALWDLLGQTYGRLRGGAKVLAEDTGASHAAAENWLRRRNLPQGESLVALMAASPAVNDLVQQAVARRIATTKTRRAAWRVSYDAALGAVGPAEGIAAGGPDGWSLDGSGARADVAGVAVLGVDRRAAR